MWQRVTLDKELNLNKIKAPVVAILAALAMLVGGVIVSAPAQAITGTTVYVFSAHGNGWTKTTNINGWDKIIHEGETANNVQFFCPPSDGWELYIIGPNNTHRLVAPGLCYFPNNSGTYQVGVFYAWSTPDPNA